MAAFLARALSLPSSGRDFFLDDGSSIFQSAINRVAAARITLGCNPPTNDRYCPTELVTRGQMAVFIRRTFEGAKQTPVRDSGRWKIPSRALKNAADISSTGLESAMALAAACAPGLASVGAAIRASSSDSADSRSSSSMLDHRATLRHTRNAVRSRGDRTCRREAGPPN